MTSRLEKLQAFLAQDPNDSFTRYAIGLEYASQKDYSKAIETLEALRQHDPNYVATYYQLASFYREQGESAKALEVTSVGIKAARAVSDLHAASELQALQGEIEDEG